jgi:HPr kinase/phosphorylase
MLQTPLTIQRLYDDNRDSLQLGWFAGFPGGERLISGDAVSAADQVGHLNLIHPGRIQVFGHQELNYYQRLKTGSRSHMIGEMIAGGPPALIIAQGLDTPPDILAICDEQNIPLFSTPLPAAQVIDFLRVYLSKKLAQRVIMHGVFMDVLGVGVLITGDSGLGKSELGLELISRSHGLVADDAVEFSRIAPNMIEGRCPPLLQNLLEVRGLGLLDIKAIFGETAVRRKMRLKLIVHLVKRGALDEEVERLPFHFPTEDVLGLPIRSRPQHRGAAGSRGAQYHFAAARYRYAAGVHGAATAGDERRLGAAGNKCCNKVTHCCGIIKVCASFSLPVSRAPANRLPSTSSKTQAITASTTCRLPCCPRWSTRSMRSKASASPSRWMPAAPSR